ncbi:hypothetical protein JG687_00011965 [Phytophthora cactorum]|uniref:Uncharacterized protein n=1 Tax=Phytophthora cactorum TaxID=29920 RepID=A0A8T1U373_9STRA|nr:hypothetical protein JG687_00011965 [Phytophthora cactorum]
MTERRLRCGSKMCKLYGSCKFGWKAWLCEQSNRCQVVFNRIDHVRDGSVHFDGPHKTIITAKMKKNILQQDECAVPPQLILSSMRRSSDVLQPKRVMDAIVRIHCADNMNTYYTLNDTVLAEWRKIPQL